MTNNDLMRLPEGLPVPKDDGFCNHLQDLTLPALSLPSTSGIDVNLSSVEAKWLVIYCYPLTGNPCKALPKNWDQIAGARGCTPQALTFNANIKNFDRLSAKVFGLSTQPTDYQRELKQRLNLEFDFLSDDKFNFVRTLNLPTFNAEGQDTPLIKRLTLIVKNGVIKKVFYPIFPPTENADEVLLWLKSNESLR